jgi:hypothetical protein
LEYGSFFSYSQFCNLGIEIVAQVTLPLLLDFFMNRFAFILSLLNILVLIFAENFQVPPMLSLLLIKVFAAPSSN